MQPLDMIVTAAGLDALVDAQNGETDPIRIAEIGLTETSFVAAPTLEALPGELARIGAISGQSIAANVIHMTAQDSTDAIYDLRGLALYLDDGTLFAVYAQDDPLFRKVSIASFLFAIDVAFNAAVAGDIEFGDASFLYPPATETVKGVAEIATQAEVTAGEDNERIVTPLKLKAAIDGIPSIGDATEELSGKIELATQAETDAGADDARAVTPLKLKTALDAIPELGDATEAQAGKIELATQAETDAGADDARAVTPLKLKGVIDSIPVIDDATEAAAGKIELATQAETDAGTDDARAVTPLKLATLLTDQFGFDSLLAPAGYVRFPGGFIVQWLREVDAFDSGVEGNPPGFKFMAFPIEFPTACLSVQLTTRTISLDSEDVNNHFYQVHSDLRIDGVQVIRKNPGTVGNNQGETECFLFAVGY